ncbi:MAG: gliding motility protein GldC [Bacteroidota bacterium]
MSNVKRTSEIKIQVGLDEDNVPIRLNWQSTDSAVSQEVQECKAMLLALFDKENLDTLKIDLWTKEMQVIEMDRFFFQTLRGLADTYFRATKNKELAADMQKFVQYFGEQTKVLSKE